MFWRSAVVAGSVVLMAAPLHLRAQDAPVRLEMIETAYRPEPSEVRLMTPTDGYLMLVHVANGKVRVLFPIRTGGSSAIAGGDYTLDQLGISIPWANGRGAGVIVAAWSPTPIRTDQFVRYGHWAVSDLERKAFLEDPAVATIELVTRLGATPGSVTSVEYGSIRTVSEPRVTASRSYFASNRDDYPWKVYQNLIRIQGPARCSAGSRDVTGAGESCSAPPEPPRSSPRRVVEPASVYDPPRPLQSPASRAAPSPPPPASRPATPPPAERPPSRKPL